MAKKNIDGLRGPRGRGEGEWWRVEERRVRATLSSAPMKTGAKCFDIYRLPLLPGRFADGSEASRGGQREEEKKQEEEETRGGGGGSVVGYIFWRKANDNGRGTTTWMVERALVRFNFSLPLPSLLLHLLP